MAEPRLPLSARYGGRFGALGTTPAIALVIVLVIVLVLVLVLSLVIHSDYLRGLAKCLHAIAGRLHGQGRHVIYAYNGI